MLALPPPVERQGLTVQLLGRAIAAATIGAVFVTLLHSASLRNLAWEGKAGTGHTGQQGSIMTVRRATVPFLRQSIPTQSGGSSHLR